MIRAVIPEIDAFSYIVKSYYHLIAIKDNEFLDEVNETHTQILFPQELIHNLKETVFEILRFCECPNLEGEPSEDTWNDPRNGEKIHNTARAVKMRTESHRRFFN